ncbi:MAG: PAS domain S-box protein, partial [candidate division Zixibacteria bacterium]
MAKKYDRYELEIIISLGFLILFLISINFISGYSFERAMRGQAAQFEKAANISANYIRTELEKDINKWAYSDELLLERLRDLSMLTDIENIIVSDTSGQIIGQLSSTLSGEKAGTILTIKRPLRLRSGRTAGYITVAAANSMGDRFNILSRWDTAFRVAGLIAALIVAAFFIKAVLYPYQRIKREALDYNLDLRDDTSGKGIEYVIDTFKDVISELEDKKTRLETMYRNSEKRADSLARYNEYILGSISSGVVICDSNGIVTRFNRSVEHILRYFEKECRGKHYCEIFGRGHRLTSMLDDALNEGIVHSRLEFEIKRPDGEKLWLGCSSSMINDEKGEGMGAVLLMIDLTEIRRLQELSSYSEKMASLGEMSAGIAHEIRNSFATVLGFAKLAKKSGNLGDRAAKLVDAIREESVATEALLSRFLNFARPFDFSPEAIDIRNLINST